MSAVRKCLYRCAGCHRLNRPSGYVLCRQCWASKVPQSMKITFNRTRGYEAKMVEARKILEHVIQ